MKVKSDFLVKPHTDVRLSHWPTAPKHHKGKHHNDDETADNTADLAALQEVLYASQQRALLIVLQGMDTAGKDGTVRHIFSGVNPAGCNVASFKVPTSLERRHDFLWRCHQKVPALGEIAIFNRSHYEDVLSPVVHGLVTHKQAKQRMVQINDFERMLLENGTTVLKFFLHISQDEQTARLQARLDEPDKNWKLEAGDFHERRYWDDYTETYERILSNTSTSDAPWFVIPADNKPARNVMISSILVDAMRGMKLHYPKPAFEAKGIQLTELKPKAAEKLVERRVAAAGGDSH